jgi:hypothetical protein
MPVDSQTEMERTPLSQPESLRVRCPHCRKLYLVQFSDIQEAKPRFECVGCRDRFWISLADMDFSTEVDGLPVHVKAPPPKPAFQIRVKDAVNGDPCPKCFKLTPKHSPDCIHCGVVIGKMKELEFKEPVPAHSPHLETLWDAVISGYEIPAKHDEFIRACQIDGNLQYAGAVYTQMLKLMPTDEVSVKRLEQVKAIATLSFPFERKAASIWRTSTRLWQVPLLGGVFCVGVGLALPAFRNIAGVGAAFLFLAMAMRR